MKKQLNDFPEELKLGSKPNIRPEREATQEIEHGFCIRSGRKIKFNPKQPMSRESWRIWNEYGMNMEIKISLKNIAIKQEKLLTEKHRCENQ